MPRAGQPAASLAEPRCGLSVRDLFSKNKLEIKTLDVNSNLHTYMCTCTCNTYIHTHTHMAQDNPVWMALGP